MKMYQKAAFSLIELMVVIAIIGIIAAIAVPTYSQYSTKAKIVTLINTANGVLQTVSKIYQSTGSFPASSFVMGSVSIPSGGSNFTPVPNLGNITSVSYTVSADGKGIGFLFGTTGLPPSLGANINLYMGVRDVSGVIRVGCGNNGGSDNSIPLSYLPGSCQCSPIGFNQGSNTFISGPTVPSGC